MMTTTCICWEVQIVEASASKPSCINTSISKDTETKVVIMYFPILLLLAVVQMSSADWAPDGTWINPVYCGPRECPPFIQLDDGTKPYEIREYLSAKWMCIDFHSNIPQTSEEYYVQTDNHARHWNYHILRNYTKGDNSEDLIIPLNVPVITFMYYKQNAMGMYLKIANDFRMCYYLTLDDEPAPNHPDIEIGIEPAKTYYVWQFNNYHFDATRFEAELASFLTALSTDGVTDFDPSFHATGGYGPYLSPIAHNEIWLEKV